MGKEIVCRATLAGRPVRTRAHLDGGGLVLRGELRMHLSPSDLRDARAEGERLIVATPSGELALELGAAAPAWAGEMRQPKTVVAKFGIKADFRVYLRRVSNAGFARELAQALHAPLSAALRGTFDCIVAQFDVPEALGELETLAGHLQSHGALWLVTPKGKASPVKEGMVRAAIARAHLVDVKICAFDATHTATKAVIPIALRRSRAH